MKSRSKAQTLRYVEPLLSRFKVPEFLVFEVPSYLQSSHEVIGQIQSIFRGRPLVIRSSASDEDGKQHTRAGEYASVLNVPSTDANAVREAIATVVASYGRNGTRTRNDELIVQEFLLETSMSGVVFTHDLNTGAPYYVINYDDVSGLTNTVTSGGGEYANRTLYIHRGATPSVRSERFQRLLQAIQELERAMKSEFLDVEFALGADLTPYLLQVRAITTQPNWNRAVARRIDAALQGIQTFVKARLNSIAGVYGKTTVLGQMPDWNPAEMIGRAPRALAYSLYETLITNHAWRNAREQMGYAVPAGQPLMVSLAGQPFIDTRLSFHSYLPASVSPQIGEKLVDAWVSRLRACPELHDKVEFEVAITTFTFDIDERMESLVGPALNSAERSELKGALRELTQRLLAHDSDGGVGKALQKVEALAVKQAAYSQSASSKDITMLHQMIEDCIRLGTIPFAILARHGFIARTLLVSLSKRGILTANDVNGIQSSIRTVASALVTDMRRFQLGEVSRSEFMAQYGHLRPGTYDILSRRYDEMPDFGAGQSPICPEREVAPYELNARQKQQIDRVLRNEGFSHLDHDVLLRYIEAAMIGREYSKFVFTRSVSEML
jgi:hypothetical protein